MFSGKHLVSLNYFEGRADGKLNFLKTFLSLFQVYLNYFNDLYKEMHKIENDVVVKSQSIYPPTHPPTLPHKITYDQLTI